MTEPENFVGQVIPAGIKYGRWLYVTHVETDNVFGHVWTTGKGWNKGRTAYARAAVFKATPGGKKPDAPERV